MELTPKLLIEDVDFPVVRKGYDPDQVDTFLERVAAGLAQIQRQLAEARERAALAEKRLAAAEERPADAGAAVDTRGTDEIQRTLVLAQRTADAAVAEAKEEAARLVEEARAESKRLLDEAGREAARRDEEARARLREEIDQLSAERDGLRAESAALQRHAGEQRDRLRASLDDLQRLIDDPGAFAVTPPPGGESRPAPAPAPAIDVRDQDDRGDEGGSGGSGEPATLGGPADRRPTGGAGDDPAGRDAAGDDPIDLGGPDPSAVIEAEPTPPEAHEAPSHRAELDRFESAVADLASSTELAPKAASRAFAGGDGGPPTKLHQALTQAGGVDVRDEGARPRRTADAPAARPAPPLGGSRPRGNGLRPPTSSIPGLGITDEDAFLRELREAMDDDSPLGPRDEDERQPGHEERRRGRFRRR